MEVRYFREKVIRWYDFHKRMLPWRESNDPYKIWLSEIILQQTRVAQGLPYYNRFLEKFPDVFSLANATEQEVLRLWQGLGYYSRARNLHKCARIVVTDYGGLFPIASQELLKLPGIGEYTAAAIASFSNKEPVAVVDGNVYRVLSRVFGIETEITSPSGKREFQLLANSLIDVRQPDLYNQAVMEFGALCCTPKNPGCTDCPLNQNCVAYKGNLQSDLPVKKKKAKPVTRYFYYFVFKKGNSLLMKQRSSQDIWQGLFDFFLVESKRQSEPAMMIRRNPTLRGLGKNSHLHTSGEYKHLLSHQTIISRFIVISDEEGSLAVEEENLRYYPTCQIGELPKPVLITRFLKDFNFL
jgi:A/G-specific adenine glycosylase